MERNGTTFTKVAADLKDASPLMRKVRAEIKQSGLKQADIVRWALMQRYGMRGFIPFVST